MRQLLNVIEMFLMFIAIFNGMSSLAFAQESDLKKEVEELKQRQHQLGILLKDIISLISQRVPVPKLLPIDVQGAVFELSNCPVNGSDKAQLTLIEFTDYQCQYCGRHVRETFPKILEQYIDKGIIRYAILNLPLSKHNLATKAAEASHCAGDQGKFWEMHNLMMSKQESLNDLSALATSLKLDIAQFEECLHSSKYAEEIKKNAALASMLGIASVPGFVLAFNSQNQTKHKGINYIRGAQPFSSFQNVINQALSDIKSGIIYK